MSNFSDNKRIAKNTIDICNGSQLIYCTGNFESSWSD